MVRVSCKDCIYYSLIMYPYNLEWDDVQLKNMDGYCSKYKEYHYKVAWGYCGKTLNQRIAEIKRNK